MRRVTSALVLLGLLGGVPAVLVRFVGWPLPRAVPPLSLVVLDLRSGFIPDGVLIKSLACIVWAAWASLAASIVFEAAVNVPRLARGLHPRRPPLVNRPFASLASQLVAGILTVSAATSAGATVPTRPPAPITATLPLVTSPASSPRWVAQRGDTLWGIAQASTGEAERVVEIVQLNHALLSRPSDLRAGMTVVLPPDATVPDDRQPPAVTTDLPASTHVVTAGESMWTIAAGRVAAATGSGSPPAVAPYWVSVMDDNREVPNPNLIYPGEVLDLPAIEVPSPPPAHTPVAVAPPDVTPLPVSPAPVPPAQEVAPVPAPAPPTPRARSGHAWLSSGWDAPAVAGLGGSALLAAWVVIEARRRRERSLRRSQPGTKVSPPTPAATRAGTAVRAAADVVATSRVEDALRHLATLAAEHRLDIRLQILMRRPDGTIDVYLAVAVDPPQGDVWESDAGGRVWTLDARSEISVAGDVPAPCPALVQLGNCPDGAEVYADLEGLGTLSIGGNADAARQIARAICATLAVSPAANLCRILTVGFDPFGFGEGFDGRVVALGDVEGLIGDASATARPITEGLISEKCGSSFRLRATAIGEAWAPAVAVVAGVALDDHAATRLASIAGEGGAGAAIVACGIDAACTLDFDADDPPSWTLYPFGIRLQPVALAADELRDLTALLTEADAELVPDEQLAEHMDEPPAPDGWLAMIRLCGVPDVAAPDGRTGTDKDRDQTLELLAWLATHRGRATRADATNAVWGGRPVSSSTVANMLSNARRLLKTIAGDPPDGEQWIQLNSDSVELHRSVATDHDWMRAMLKRADTLPPGEAAELLVAELPRLRGMPLGGTAWEWTDEEHLTSNVALAAASLAIRLASLRLDQADPAGALEAADAGLRVIPCHDQLTLLAMRAWAANGERSAALAVYSDYERALAARGEEVSKDIARLRNELRLGPADA